MGLVVEDFDVVVGVFCWFLNLFVFCCFVVVVFVFKLFLKKASPKKN